MKRIITIMIVVAAALSCATATAQIHFGVRGGLTLNNIKFRDWGDVRDEFNNRIGFNVGVSLEVGIPVTGLSEINLPINPKSLTCQKTVFVQFSPLDPFPFYFFFREVPRKKDATSPTMLSRIRPTQIAK